MTNVTCLFTRGPKFTCILSDGKILRIFPVDKICHLYFQMGKSNIYISKCPDITSIFPDDQIYCVYLQMTQFNHSSSQVLGPFLINSSILCFHSSIFPDWTMNTTNHVPDHQQLLQAAVPCPSQLVTNSMEKSLVYFWNISFTLIIITAVLCYIPAV